MSRTPKLGGKGRFAKVSEHHQQGHGHVDLRAGSAPEYSRVIIAVKPLMPYGAEHIASRRNLSRFVKGIGFHIEISCTSNTIDQCAAFIKAHGRVAPPGRQIYWIRQAGEHTFGGESFREPAHQRRCPTRRSRCDSGHKSIRILGGN